MQLAFDLSVQLGLCKAEAALRVRRHFAAMGLPATLAALMGGVLSADALLRHMQKDKKVKDGKVTLILARAIGDAIICGDVPLPTLGAFLAAAVRHGTNSLEPAASPT